MSFFPHSCTVVDVFDLCSFILPIHVLSSSVVVPSLVRTFYHPLSRVFRCCNHPKSQSHHTTSSNLSSFHSSPSTCVSANVPSAVLMPFYGPVIIPQISYLRRLNQRVQNIICCVRTCDICREQIQASRI